MIPKKAKWPGQTPKPHMAFTDVVTQLWTQGPVLNEPKLWLDVDWPHLPKTRSKAALRAPLSSKEFSLVVSQLRHERASE